MGESLEMNNTESCIQLQPFSERRNYTGGGFWAELILIGGSLRAAGYIEDILSEAVWDRFLFMQICVSIVFTSSGWHRQCCDGIQDKLCINDSGFSVIENDSGRLQISPG